MRPLHALALVALAAGCTQGPGAPSASSPFEPSPNDSLPTAQEPKDPNTFVTRILPGGVYEHPRLDAATQATIVWRNDDAQTHSVVSVDGQFAGSGPVAPGGEFRHTFLTPGDFAYHCRYHSDAMRGIVVVR